MADPETMGYNRAWGGTIPFPQDKWGKRYEIRVNHSKKRFHKHITTGESRSFVGETAYHYDETQQVCMADMVISARCRRQGCGKAGLELFCAAAGEAGITELYDGIAADNPGIALFFQCGFREVSRTGEAVLLKKELQRQAGRISGPGTEDTIPIPVGACRHSG